VCTPPSDLQNKFALKRRGEKNTRDDARVCSLRKTMMYVFYKSNTFRLRRGSAEDMKVTFLLFFCFKEINRSESTKHDIITMSSLHRRWRTWYYTHWCMFIYLYHIIIVWCVIMIPFNWYNNHRLFLIFLLSFPFDKVVQRTVSYSLPCYIYIYLLHRSSADT